MGFFKKVLNAAKGAVKASLPNKSMLSPKGALANVMSQAKAGVAVAKASAPTKAMLTPTASPKKGLSRILGMK